MKSGRSTSSRSTPTTVDGIHRLEDLGVTDVIVGFRNPYLEAINSQTLEQKLDLLRGYADTVIAQTSP